MTYMTNILDQKHLYFDFLWMFQRLMLLKWNIVLIQNVEILKMMSKMAVS